MTETPPPVRVSAAFESAPERLFAAWTDPAIARRWLFATPDGEMARTEIDARDGGAFTITERRAGAEVEHRGRFLHLEAPHRLAFAFAVPAVSAQETQVSVSIMPLGGWCILTLVHEGVPPDLAARTQEGWTRMLDRLATVLEAATPERVETAEGPEAARPEGRP